jgi:branched-chain amino acid transport system ATP-binding protein
MSNSLRLKGVEVNYGKARAVSDVTVEVAEHAVTGIIGANGAGKSTIMRAISGLLRPSKGEIWFGDYRLDRTAGYKIVQLGVVQVPEGRRLFPQMSVLANVKMGAYLRKDRTETKRDMDRIFERFPVLGQRRSQRAETLSGGEQQMLAIARALMARPKVLLMDEPSWGLAPLVVEEVANIITDIARDGITVLLVEQNAGLTMKVTQYAYVLEVGRVAMEGNIKELMANENVRRAFLG